MRRIRFGAGFLAAGVVGWGLWVLSLGALGTSAANADQRKDVPAPASILAQAYKNLVKSGSYETTIAITGGVTKRDDHKVTHPTVRQNYEAAVVTSPRRPIMKVTRPRAYRTPSGGAIESAGIWRNIHSDRQGKRMDRLFAFPETVLARALKHKRAAEWVERSKKKKKGAKRSKGKKDEKLSSDAKTKKKGKTSVAKGRDAEKPPLPGYIRVNAPTKEALQHFIEVENSGCFGGG